MREKHATRVPTVLIGVGGIGGEIVRQVYKALRDYDRQYVQMLVLDTNTNDLKKSSEISLPFVQTSENKTVSDYLKQNKRFQEWFPMNPLINAKNLTQGAGQIRSVSRLGALSSEDAHRFDTIRQAIENVSRNTGDPMHNMVRVMIVGSVCGGTGSGMGIQLPFLVRDLVEEIAHMPRTIIRGLFVMPDTLEEVQDTDEKKKSIYVNGYAFLRELNAFNKAQTFQRGTEKLKIEHYRRDEVDLRDDPTQMSHQVPYDFLFLIEKSNINGQNIGGFAAYLSKAAQIVKAQLFASDMTADLLSSEDNLIVAAVNRDGMNRYCGAGISRVIYPEEENHRYCVLRYSESILQGYWLRIDREVNVNMTQHRRQMASDPSLMPKDPQEEYVTVFDKLTDPTQSDVTREMGFLKRELTFESVTTDPKGNEIVNTVNYAANLIDAIRQYVSDLYMTSELEKAGKQCQMQHKDLMSDRASTYCENKLNSLKLLEKSAKKREGDIVAGAIDAIIGADAMISDAYSNAVKYPFNIPAVIKDKHPIVARYILYSVRKALNESIAAAESELSVFNEEKTIFQKDYYIDPEKKKNGEKDNIVEDPAQALRLTKPGMLSTFGIKSAEYKRLVAEIERDTNKYISRVYKMAELQLIKDVFSTVVKRMDILIEIYERFFSELERIMYKYKADREILEEGQDRIQGSDIYICMDRDCKEWLYQKFKSNTSDEDMTLPDELKKTFFDAIFGEYFIRYKIEKDPTSFTDKPLSMTELFETAILDPLTDKYKDREMAHIHMDIISALKLEYRIHSKVGTLKVYGSLVDPVDYDFNSYFESIMVQLKNLSAPYLSYSTVSEEINSMLTPNANVEDVAYDTDDDTAVTTPPSKGRVLCYWGINNGAVARHQHREEDGEIDRDGLRSMFGPSEEATYFVINDDSFDAREIVCYSSVYDLMIENLDKYKRGSKAQKEYSARILRVIKSDFNVGTGASAYLDTVHPHLDRRWHSHAYLPMLCIDEEVEERERIARAFLLSVACQRVWYMQLDYVSCWTFRQSNNRLPKPLNIHGESAVRSSFRTLYEAMDENTVAVNDVLKVVAGEEKKAYDSARIGGVKPEDILKHPVICGFIGDKYTKEELGDLETIFKNIYANNGTARLPINILEVIYSVYKDSYDLELVTWLVDQLTAYLKHYCLKMTNDQKGAASVLFKIIAKEIGKNFNTNDVDMQFIMLCDIYL